MKYTPQQKTEALQAVWSTAKNLEEAIQLAEKYLAYVYADEPDDLPGPVY